MKTAQYYKLTFTALSPIHIGTGEEIDPLEYVMKKPAGEYPKLYRINLPKVIAAFSEEKRMKFLELLNKQTNDSNVIEVRRFIRENVNIENNGIVCYEVPAEEDLFKYWRSNSSNALIVNPVMRRLDTWQAIIPGSSIKGAIRTAILSPRMEQAPNDNRRFGWELPYLQAKDPYDDPFRALQIADVTLPDNAVQIDSVKMIHLKPQKTEQTSGIQQFYEMTFNALVDDEDAPTQGSGSLTLNTGLSAKGQLKLQLTKDEIIKCCRDFYIPKAKEEHRKFYEHNPQKEIRDNSEKLRHFLDNLQQNEFPIRLGHFSHCEAMTVEKYRRPETRFDRKTNSNLPWGTTRTLANGQYPLGWAKITLE